MVSPIVSPLELRPQAGPQEAFLASPADIVIYGGSAGGGKSYGLLLEAARHTCNPGFGAVIFRRTAEEIRMEGGLWDEAQNLYPPLGARGRQQQLDFRFPSGAWVTLDSIQHEQDKLRFQGAQICMMGFDELTHFTESMFFYMLSRNRSTCGVRPYVRATTNPDATSWVKIFLAPWLNSNDPNPAESGEIRWFIRDGGEITWVEAGTPDAKSVTFIRANIFDNKILLAKDPGYVATLKALSLVDRQRLLDGNWDIVEGGNMFKPEWFRIVDVLPEVKRWVRFWDMAASEVKPGKDPDWTVGVRMGITTDNEFVISQVDRMRESPLTVEKRVRACAEHDGQETYIRMEQEPGSSGLTVIDNYHRNILRGFQFQGTKSTGSKAERAKAYSASAEKGHVLLMRAMWNQDFINEHSPFSTPGIHDDQVDAASGAFTYIAKPPLVMQIF